MLTTFPRSPIADRLEHIWRMAFRAPFSPAFPGLFSAAVANKPWLAGGVPASYAVGIYNFKGAASYAASKVNLANPGTYDAADGTAYPTWDVTNGAKFVLSSSQYLTLGGLSPYPNTNWSMIIRFSNSVAGLMAIGFYSGATSGFAIHPLLGGQTYFTNAAEVNSSTGATSGVLAIANRTCYRNGSSVATLSAAGLIGNYAMQIGASATGTPRYWTGYMQAAWIYNTSVAAYMTALTTAINAL